MRRRKRRRSARLSQKRRGQRGGIAPLLAMGGMMALPMLMGMMGGGRR